MVVFRCRSFRVLMALLLSWGGIGAVLAQPLRGWCQGEDINKAIWKAWKARQDKVQSLVFAWSRKAHTPKGALALQVNKIGGVAITDANAEPADTTTENPRRLVIDGQNMRFESDESIWNWQTRQYMPKRWVTTWNGFLFKSFCHDLQTDHMQGGIHPHKYHREIDNPDLCVLLMTYRGLTDGMRTVRIEELKSQAKALQENEVRIVLSTGRAGDETYLWVDPARDYVVTRLISKGDFTVQTDAAYRKDNVHGWVPSSWGSICTRNDGRVVWQSRSVVRSYEINDQVPSAEFDIVFPRGTYVIDDVSKTMYQQGWSLLDYWLLFLGVAVVVAGIGLWMWRRRRRALT